MRVERTLTEHEFKILNKQLDRIKHDRIRQIKFLTFWSLAAFIIGGCVWFNLSTQQEKNLLVGVVLIYILIGVWVFLENIIKGNRQKQSIEFVKKSNKTLSIKVKSTDYCELEEEEDEGFFYLFQLADNKILSFGGQDFYPTKKFPSDDFEIAICYGQKNEIVLLETYNLGQKISPKYKLNGQRKWDLLGSINYPNPENFTITDGNIEEIITNKIL